MTTKTWRVCAAGLIVSLALAGGCSREQKEQPPPPPPQKGSLVHETTVGVQTYSPQAHDAIVETPAAEQYMLIGSWRWAPGKHPVICGEGGCPARGGHPIEAIKHQQESGNG